MEQVVVERGEDDLIDRVHGDHLVDHGGNAGRFDLQIQPDRRGNDRAGFLKGSNGFVRESGRKPGADINGLDLRQGEVGNAVSAASDSFEGGIVKDDGDAVAAGADIAFNAVRTKEDGGAKGDQGILRRLSRCATMRPIEHRRYA